MYYIFAFRARTQAMRFYDCLRANALAVEIVTTPRRISVGCGLSVKIDRGVEIAKKCLNDGGFSSFLGAFKIDGSYIERLIV